MYCTHVYKTHKNHKIKNAFAYKKKEKRSWKMALPPDESLISKDGPALICVHCNAYYIIFPMQFICLCLYIHVAVVPGYHRIPEHPTRYILPAAGTHNKTD